MRHSFFAANFLVVTLLISLIAGASEQQNFNRSVLPIQEPKRPTYSELDVRNAKAPPRFEVKAPNPKGHPTL